jgi:hypothetical protein
MNKDFKGMNGKANHGTYIIHGIKAVLRHIHEIAKDSQKDTTRILIPWIHMIGQDTIPLCTVDITIKQDRNAIHSKCLH